MWAPINKVYKKDLTWFYFSGTGIYLSLLLLTHSKITDIVEAFVVLFHVWFCLVYKQKSLQCFVIQPSTGWSRNSLVTDTLCDSPFIYLTISNFFFFSLSKYFFSACGYEWEVCMTYSYFTALNRAPSLVRAWILFLGIAAGIAGCSNDSLSIVKQSGFLLIPFRA